MAELWKQLRYTSHVMFHPFDGFWDLKHEHRGSMKAAIVLIAMLVINSILGTQFTGFLYNPNYDGVSLNVFSHFTSVVGTFLLWCVSNWCLTTLMDGEGSFKDIVMVTAYALAPLFVINIPLTFISNIMPLDYEAFYNIISNISVLWAGFLMLSGLMVVHQYSLGKTLLTAVLIVVGMAVIVFLGLLFFNLISQLISFVVEIYWELSLRYF